MAKTKSLLDQLREDTTCVHPGPEKWSDKLRRSEPAKMKEIDGIIDAWINNDPTVRERLPHMSTVADWLMRKITGLPRNQKTVVNYIRERAANGTQR